MTGYRIDDISCNVLRWDTLLRPRRGTASHVADFLVKKYRQKEKKRKKQNHKRRKASATIAISWYCRIARLPLFFKLNLSPLPETPLLFRTITHHAHLPPIPTLTSN